MKTVTVKVTTDDGRDNSNTSIIVERDRGAGYVRMDSKDYVTNKDKAMEFKLRQGERLVVEAYAPEAVAYDRDQGVAYKTASQKDPNKLDSPLDKSTKIEDEIKKQEHDRLAAASAPVKPSEPPRTTLENPAPEPVASSQIVGKDDDKKPTPSNMPKEPAGAPKSHDPNPGLISSKDKK
jgi:hypothetical protein